MSTPAKTRVARSVRPPGMHDVARLAGVSHQTVSRVLNGSNQVRGTTRARVEEAIKELDYRRNMIARALATGRSQTLGVISMDTTLYGPASTLHGIESAARAAGYFVTTARLKVIDRALVLEALNRLMALAVDGIVIIAPQLAAVEALSDLPKYLPVVAIGDSPSRDIAAVAVDQSAGAKLATQHLLDRSHETVWHVAGPSDWSDASARTSAWRSSLERAGAVVPDVLQGDWSARSGFLAGQQLAKMREVTAISAGNDHMALGVLRALTEAGRLVPHDVSLVGFDDVPEGEFYSPPLTTILQDFDELGRTGFRVLLTCIEGTWVPNENLAVPARLIVRRSCGSPVTPPLSSPH